MNVTSRNSNPMIGSGIGVLQTKSLGLSYIILHSLSEQQRLNFFIKLRRYTFKYKQGMHLL